MNTALSSDEIWNVRERILASFLSDIGVKTGLDKKSNTVTDEINAGTPSMLINLDDMLNARKEGFERVNKKFGTSWTVELNENLDYINEFIKGGSDNEDSGLLQSTAGSDKSASD